MAEKSNRRVFARVSLDARAYEPEHFENAFKEEGWSLKKFEEGEYLVAVPMYCSRFASMDVARAKIADFEEQFGRLIVRYMRREVHRRPADKVYRSYRARGGWVSALPFVKHLPPELRTVGSEWEIYSSLDLQENAFDRLQYVYPELAESDTVDLAKTVSPRSVVDPEDAWWKWLALMVGVAVGIAVAVALAVVLFTPGTDSALRILSALVLLGLAVVAGLWATGSSDRLLVRLWGIICTAAGLIGLGYLSRQFLDDIDQIPWAALMAGILLMFIVRGIRHLVILRPGVRLLGTISVLGLAAGSSVAGTRAMIGGILAEFGVSLERVALPQWVTYSAGISLFVYVALALLLVAAVWGWGEYNGMSAAFRTSRDILSLLVAMILIVYALGAAIVALAQGESVYREWLSEFQAGSTPSVTSDFAYRACLVEKGPGDVSPGNASQIRTVSPMVVIEAKDGPGWAWDPLGRNPRGSFATVAVDSDSYDVVRIPDGIYVCPVE